MKSIVSKLFRICVVLGALWAMLSLYVLLRQYCTIPTAIAVTLLSLIPFLLYGIARTLHGGRLRRLCNLVGGALISADCYFMIFTAIVGVALVLGLPLRYAGLLLTLDLCLTVLCVLFGMLGSLRIQTVHYSLRLDGVTPCRIVFFSDLHLG